uniref:PilZ domain-containing protein n=1 Tax=Picea glauca TaxID=3330 RepID=A0A101M056_PICGL|nr:hypothetical protein ABT39_MTgene4611 [Picea glauca]
MGQIYAFRSEHFIRAGRSVSYKDEDLRCENNQPKEPGQRVFIHSKTLDLSSNGVSLRVDPQDPLPSSSSIGVLGVV